MARTRGCWASVLDDCDGPLTGEHTISVNAFAPPAGQPDTRRGRMRTQVSVGSAPDRLDFTTSVRNLKTNVLCGRHNGDLSDTDRAAGDFSRAIDSWAETVTQRRVYPSLNWSPRFLDVDGACLERWFLKSVITNAVRLGLPIGCGAAEPGSASRELAEIVFGRRSINRQTGTGLSQLAIQGTSLRITEAFGFALLENAEHGYISGGLVSFKSFVFAVQFDSERLTPMSFRRRWNRGDILHGWSLDDLEVVQPPRTITSGSSRAIVRLYWPADPTAVETTIRYVR